MNVVSIMAHADDEMRCLGTMLKCSRRGDTLAFVTVTDGSHGYVQDPTLPRARVAAIRSAEMDAVAAAVGGTHVCLGEEDEFLYDTPEVRMRLIEAIRATRADVIFTHYGEDYNLDHVTVSTLVRHCAMQSCLPYSRPPRRRSLRTRPSSWSIPTARFRFPHRIMSILASCKSARRRCWRCTRRRRKRCCWRSATG